MLTLKKPAAVGPGEWVTFNAVGDDGQPVALDVFVKGWRANWMEKLDMMSMAQAGPGQLLAYVIDHRITDWRDVLPEKADLRDGEACLPIPFSRDALDAVLNRYPALCSEIIGYFEAHGEDDGVSVDPTSAPPAARPPSAGPTS